MRRMTHSGISHRKLARAQCAMKRALLLASLCALPLRGQDVLTYHNDNARTGQNLNETILTPANVNSTQFGKLFQLSVDGKVDAEPLYASSVAIPGQGTHNVLYVETEHDSVYAFDADDGAQLWHVSVIGSGETTSDNRGCTQVTPEIGITSTPVIDRSSGPNGTIYVAGMTKDSTSAYHQRIHALDLTTGAELFGGPVEVQASYPGTGANSNGTNVIFDPGQYEERASLLLLNQVIYTSWTSHCDFTPYTGWIIAYNESTLSQVNVLNLTPNGNDGSIWMSGSGLAADSAGNIYPLMANGTFDTSLNAGGFPSSGDYGNAMVKVSTANGGLAVADYFTMSSTVAESNADEDLGSGGALLLPDMTDANGVTRQLAVGAGKDQTLYLADRNNMGKFNSSADNIYQELPGSLPGGIWGAPAYFNGWLYYGPVGSSLMAFQFTQARIQLPPISTTATTFAYPGATPSISADGTSNGIVWATENTSPAVLHAYAANNLTNELYNSNQAGTRDQFGSGNKFITPMIANGKVYVGTTNGVGAFGLLASIVDFILGIGAGSSPSADVAPGESAQYSLSLAAEGGFNQLVTFTCTGAPAGATCTISPSSATPSGSTSVQLAVSVATTAASIAPVRRWTFPMNRRNWAGLAVCFLSLAFVLTALARPGRRPGYSLPAALALAAAFCLAGCGGSMPATMNNSGTPAGTYNLTITGTSTSGTTTLTHSVALQLVVS